MEILFLCNLIQKFKRVSLRRDLVPTLECLLDALPLINFNFSIFSHPGHSCSNLFPLFSRLLIIGESFQSRQTFWKNILMLIFLRSCKKMEWPISSVFCFVSSSNEANTLYFALYSFEFFVVDLLNINA